jgi:hypothetical protein
MVDLRNKMAKQRRDAQHRAYMAMALTSFSHDIRPCTSPYFGHTVTVPGPVVREGLTPKRVHTVKMMVRVGGDFDAHPCNLLPDPRSTRRGFSPVCISVPLTLI